MVVEFFVKTRNCDGCNKVAAKDTWQAKVQLRQRAEHPRTLLAIEQQASLILVTLPISSPHHSHSHVNEFVYTNSMFSYQYISADSHLTRNLVLILFRF